MSGNSREVDSYQAGQWRVSVRENAENDRVDEGDYPDGYFYTQKIPVEAGKQVKFNVFRNNELVAEVRGEDSENRTIIPMRELNLEEQEEFYRFIDEHFKS